MSLPSFKPHLRLIQTDLNSEIAEMQKLVTHFISAENSKNSDLWENSIVFSEFAVENVTSVDVP